MFERYTQWARRTIFHAKYEALRRGSAEIGPKDIVLGLTWDTHKSDCPFAMLHDNADELRKLIGSTQTVYGPPKNRDIPLSNDSKKALAYAVREESLDRRYSIGADHLLRGVLLNGDETAAKLIAAGYTLSAMRQASKQAYEFSQRCTAGGLEMMCVCSPTALGHRHSNPEKVPSSLEVFSTPQKIGAGDSAPFVHRRHLVSSLSELRTLTPTIHTPSTLIPFRRSCTSVLRRRSSTIAFHLATAQRVVKTERARQGDTDMLWNIVSAH